MQALARSVSVRRDEMVTMTRLMWLSLATAILLLAQTVAAQARLESLAPLVDKISPAVVNITTTTLIEGQAGPRGIVPEGSPFEDFFREFQDRNGGEENRPRRSNALGSGFVISEDGFIVTNNHVIAEADEILIEFFPGDGQPKKELPAKVIGTDEKTDIALLKVEASGPLKYVTFGDSDTARVGDWVIAMGNPLGQGFSVSAGIVSARNRELSGSYDDYIQTDAAINRGNSGGPLFNMDGQVIGVNTAILSPNGGSIGIGFSMASNVVVKVVDQLREFGETRRGWLGVRIQDVTEDMAEAMGLDKPGGALISDVPDGPAKEAGLLPVGKAVRVVVMRDGATKTVVVTLGRREDAERAEQGATEESQAPVEEDATVLGLTIAPLTDALREDLGLDATAEGLVVMDVDEASEAFDKGLRAGDIITEAGQQKVTTIAELEARMDEAREAGRKSLLLLVRRGGDPRFVALSLEE